MILRSTIAAAALLPWAVCAQSGKPTTATSPTATSTTSAERPKLPPSALPLQFAGGERVALVGGSFGDALGRSGELETLLHSRFPKLELIIRNFCRPADEVGLRQRPSNYTSLDDPLKVFTPDTYLCFFGYNESFAGPAGVEKFKADYEKFLDDYAKQYSRPGASPAPRFVLISPSAVEASGDANFPDAKARNANLALYTKAIQEVAKKRGLAAVDILGKTADLFAKKRASSSPLMAPS